MISNICMVVEGEKDNLEVLHDESFYLTLLPADSLIKLLRRILDPDACVNNHNRRKCKLRVTKMHCWIAVILVKELEF